MVSLGSAVTANAMIGRFRDDRRITDREVLLCAVMNSIPVYIREIFTYQIPIVVPALGYFVGGLYGMVFMVTALVKVAAVIVLGRILLDDRRDTVPSLISQDSSDPERPAGNINATFVIAARRSLHGMRRLFLCISLVYLVMMFFVFLMNDRGFFDAMSVLPIASEFHIPPESIVPLTSYVANPTLGISLLGPMIQSECKAFSRETNIGPEMSGIRFKQLLIGIAVILYCSGTQCTASYIAGVHAASEGWSTDDMVGVFSIQKNIVLAGGDPVAGQTEPDDPFGSDPLSSGRIGPRIVEFDFQPRCLNSSVPDSINFTLITNDSKSAMMFAGFDPSGASPANSSGGNLSGDSASGVNAPIATFVSPSHGQSAAAVFASVNATAGAGISGAATVTRAL